MMLIGDGRLAWLGLSCPRSIHGVNLLCILALSISLFVGPVLSVVVEARMHTERLGAPTSDGSAAREAPLRGLINVIGLGKAGPC